MIVRKAYAEGRAGAMRVACQGEEAVVSRQRGGVR